MEITVLSGKRTAKVSLYNKTRKMFYENNKYHLTNAKKIKTLYGTVKRLWSTKQPHTSAVGEYHIGKVSSLLQRSSIT